MVLNQQRSRRKPSGGKLRFATSKKKDALGRDPSFTKIGERSTRRLRVRGGNEKLRVVKDDVCNLYDPKAKKYSKAKIEMVTKNPANRHFVRRNIMTKGTIIKTDKGEARITSRPGQDGLINAVLV